MKIYRQQIGITDDQTIVVPWLSKVLSVAPARDAYAIDLWYTVPEFAPCQQQLLVHIAGTGHPIPKEFATHGDDVSALHPITDNFVGTCIMPDGLVWHVFAALGAEIPFETK